LNGQHVLVAGMLCPATLLDLVRRFTLFMDTGTSGVRVVARYQQYRAVRRSVQRMPTKPTRLQTGRSITGAASAATWGGSELFAEDTAESEEPGHHMSDPVPHVRVRGPGSSTGVHVAPGADLDHRDRDPAVVDRVPTHA
jgi:hypothetical protein